MFQDCFKTSIILKAYLYILTISSNVKSNLIVLPRNDSNDYIVSQVFNVILVPQISYI